MSALELVTIKKQWQKPVVGTLEGDVVRLMKATPKPSLSSAMVCGPCPCGGPPTCK